MSNLGKSSKTRARGRAATDHDTWSNAKLIGQLKAFVRRDRGGVSGGMENIKVVIKRLKQDPIYGGVNFTDEQWTCVAELADGEIQNELTAVKQRQQRVVDAIERRLATYAPTFTTDIAP